MNKTIMNLHKRHARVLKMRTCFSRIADKEDGLLTFQEGIKKFDRLLTRINSQIKLEWNKVYKSQKVAI